MVLLAGFGVVALIGLLIVGALAVFGGDDSSAQPTLADEVQPTTSLALFGAAEDPATEEPAAPPAPDSTVAPEVTVAPEATLAPEATVAPEVTVAPDTTVAPEVTVAPETTVATVPPAADDVPESKAVVRDGQIFLEGAVPDEASGAAIVALAAEILGPDNVFNNYIVDERAGDPNLGNITVEDTINFATGSSVILPESEALLNQGFALLTIRPAMTITIVGHTDDRGSDEYNLELSEQRAESVKTWFTDLGVDGNRLTTVGKGESEPLADNTTDDGRRFNRRIQFFLENILGDA